MRPHSWIRNLFARRPGHQTRAARRRATARLHLEPLERLLLPAPVLLTSYDGVDQSLNASLNGGIVHIPPDPNAAIGTTHTVAVVNDTIEIEAKGGGAHVDSALYSFYGTIPALTKLFDPKVLWDRQSQRFFVVTLAKDNDYHSFIYLAVSPTGDPSNLSAWQKFNLGVSDFINGQHTWADYPGFGVDSAAIYVTVNELAVSGGTYEDSRLWIFDKEAMIKGLLVPFEYAPRGRGFAMQPAQMYSDLSTGPGTFLTWWGVNQLNITRVGLANIFNPTFTTYTLGTGNISMGYFNLPGAPQKGSSALIDTGDERILSTVWSHGQLYATSTVDPPSGPDAGRATAHWYRIDTTDLSNLRLADQGNIDGAGVLTNLWTYYPAVTVDDAGNMAVGFSASNATTYAGAFYTTRLAGDPAGSTEPIAFLSGGDDYYNETEFDGSRWGDYSGAGLDPNGKTFLVFNEKAGTRDLLFDPNGRWVTHYGTTAYAKHYRVVTAGGVTTLTTDNSATNVTLKHSGTSTEIDVNFVEVATTTAATVNVNAGWAGTTALQVDTSTGASTLTGSQLVSPGLTVNVHSIGDFVLWGAGGINTYTVVNTSAGPGHMTQLDGHGTDAVNVQATTGAFGFYCTDGNDVANLGNANSLAGFTGPVSINGPARVNVAYDAEAGLVDWLAIADYWAGTGVPLLDATTVTGNGGGNIFQGNGGTALIYTDGQDTIDNAFSRMALGSTAAPAT
jgi:hypothetical protein